MRAYQIEIDRLFFIHPPDQRPKSSGSIAIGAVRLWKASVVLCNFVGLLIEQIKKDANSLKSCTKFKKRYSYFFCMAICVFGFI